MSKIQNIKENWEAIQALEAHAVEKYGDPEAGFNAGTFFLSGRRSLMIPIQYRKKKGEGFTEKRYEAMVVAKFCPFTGLPLTNEID